MSTALAAFIVGLVVGVTIGFVVSPVWFLVAG